jgi:putative Holliday junction resolvase
VKIIALDHGSVRTGVAVCDETGTVARPLTVVERVGTDAGFAALISLLQAEQPRRIVVGLPLSVDVPVDLFDERFTSKLADQRGGAAARDARAAATLLEDYLRTVHEQGT